MITQESKLEKKGLLYNLKMVHFIVVNDLVLKETVKEPKFGLMEHDMKVNGKMVKLMELVSSIIRMVILYILSEIVIRLMVMGFILIKMVLNTQECGKMIYKMEKVLNSEKMDLNTMEHINKAISMGKEIIIGLMDQNIKEIE